MKITASKLCKSFEGKEVLRNLSFSVQHGECAAIRGASGIGKTTLLRLLLGLDTPDSGDLLRENTADARLPEGQIAFAGCVFQEDRLIQHLSATENLQAAFAGQKRISGKRENERFLRNALGELLPADSLDQPVSELSGGMRRRVCLARACLSHAEWLVMDEPFTGLDERSRDRAIEFLEKYRKGRTLIMATHSLEGLSWDQVISISDER